jgi:hypothetical protein
MKRAFLYIITTLIFAWSCEKADMETERLDYLAVPQGNQMVFDFTMDVRPQNGIRENDTLWIETSVTNALFTDKISQQGVVIPLNEAKFICQLRLTDLLENKPVDYTLVVKKGQLISDNLGVFALSFGYPDMAPTLKAGIVFNEIGKYALSFDNYPNPTIEQPVYEYCNTADCSGYFYDLFFGIADQQGNFSYKALVEYRFNLPEKVALNNTDAFTSKAIYDDAVFFITVR